MSKNHLMSLTKLPHAYVYALWFVSRLLGEVLATCNTKMSGAIVIHVQYFTQIYLFYSWIYYTVFIDSYPRI